MTGAGDSNFALDIYLYDRVDGHIEVISNRDDLSPSQNQSFDPTISADGRYVAFTSFDTLVAADTDGGQDIYLYDRIGNTMTLIGDATGDPAQDPSISASGQLIAFETVAALDGADINGLPDIYLYDQLTQAFTLVSTPDGGATIGDGASSLASISADGAYITFRSSATNFVDKDNDGFDDDTNTFTDIFVYKVADGSLTRVSVDGKGGELPGGASGSTGATISGNGSAVGFITGEQLVAGDTNVVNDAYVTQLSEDPEPIFGSYLGENLTGTVADTLIIAYGGDDIIDVAGGEHEIYGGEGNDDIQGGNASDPTDEDEDGLIGDVIFGEAGDDTIQGKQGSDILIGGAGNDKYIYVNVNESPDSPVGVLDSIFFEAGADTIDLSQIDADGEPGNGSFHFGGGNEGLIVFNPPDQGIVNIGGVDYFHTLVVASTNADGNAEFALHVYSDTRFVEAADFLL